MKDINQVPGTAPQETPAPFEIIIRTTDPEYPANGGEPEISVKCDGYFVALHQGSKTNVQAHGEADVLSIIRGLLRNFGSDTVTCALNYAKRMNR